jgi:propionate CoA-transferase
MSKKIMGAQEAVALIRDGDTVATTAAGMSGFPDYVVKNLEDRFLSTGHPRGLTLFSGCGHGGPDHNADNRFAHPGFLSCAIGSHPMPAAEVQQMIDRDEIEGYALPQGILNQLYRCSAAKQPGLLSKIAAGGADPTTVLTQQESMPTALQAYEAFDRREPGWTKVVLELG